jgi:hypothetical protein
MKNYCYIFLVLLSSCTPLSEQDKILEKRIQALTVKADKLRDSIDERLRVSDSLTREITYIEGKKSVYSKGKTPVYVLTLHFQEHKMELSWDRISFSFEIPVDEQFYKECQVGEELGSGSRSFKLMHSGDISVEKKRIDYR